MWVGNLKCYFLKVCELGEQLEQEKASCEGLVRQDQQAVEQYFQGLELARKKEPFMGALDTTSVEVSLAYDPLIQKLKELQVGVAWVAGQR